MSEPRAAVASESADADGESSPSPASRRPVRLALAFGIVAGVVYLLVVPWMRPDQVAIATDVYYHAASGALAGENPYAVAPPSHPSFRFQYPPAVLLAFLPHVATGSSAGAYALQTALNLATACTLAVVLVRAVERHAVGRPAVDDYPRDRLPRVDRLLIAGFALASVHTTSVLMMGQVNLQLALAVAVGATAVERDRPAAGGTALALAASVKVFPAVLGAWLVRLRAWRAVAAATLTGLAGLAVGGLAFGPDALVTFLNEVPARERQVGAFEGGLPADVGYVTLRRPIAAILPGADAATVSLLALGILVPVVLASYRDVSTVRGRLAALLATVVAALAYLPLEPFYYALAYYPLVVLCYALHPGRARRLLVAGTVALSVVLSYPAVATWLTIVPLPPGVASSADAAVRAAFRVAQPPLIGVVLVLAGCVQVQRELAASGAEESGRPAGRGPSSPEG